MDNLSLYSVNMEVKIRTWVINLLMPFNIMLVKIGKEPYIPKCAVKIIQSKVKP